MLTGIDLVDVSGKSTENATRGGDVEGGHRGAQHGGKHAVVDIATREEGCEGQEQTLWRDEGSV